jgi:glycosyltransferase involved in cell wall biosynthesis
MSDAERITVLHFLPTTGIGGPDRQVLGHLAAVDRSRFKVMVYALSDDHAACPLVERARALGVEAFWRPNRGPLDWGALREVTDLLKSSHADLLCAHGDKPHLLGLIAARRAQVPILGLVRGWTAATTRVKVYDWLDRKLLHRMDAVMAVSEAGRHALLRLGIPSERVAVVHNAVDIRGIQQEAGPSARAELGLPGAEPLVVCVGRLSPEKGHADLIEALRLIHDGGTQAHLALAGDGPERERLAQAAAAAGLAARVHFMGHRATVGPLLRDADLFALPSLTEGLPNAVLEAMAMALPVVATAVGGVPELVLDGETGVLVAAANPCALADALSRVLALNSAERRRMGDAGRARVEDHFSFEGQARRLEALYADVIAKRVPLPAGAN